VTQSSPVPGGWQPTRLPGVLRRRMASHPDSRGAFAELWRAGWTDPLDPGAGPVGDGLPSRMAQANLSRSRARVLRGLHFHLRQADLWIVLEGHPLVALVDLRDVVAGTGRPVVLTMETDPGDQLYLPSGIAHGFYAPDEMALLYLVTNAYDGSDELGFRWDDPDAAVPWPDRSPVLSERDATAPSLAELVARLRGEGALG
jgi:dTDP-4-dehydrorhamnose 3,5-epimerase